MTPYPYKRSLRSLAYYLGVMGDSHKKVIVPYIRAIFGELHAQMPEFDSITNPTVADLDRIFMTLGRATFRVDLITKANEMISRDYGRYSALSDPVLELVELKELCQNQIALLTKMVHAILQHNRKKEASNEQAGNTPSEGVVPGSNNQTPDPVGHL
jgi:hypothetical protein